MKCIDNHFEYFWDIHKWSWMIDCLVHLFISCFPPSPFRPDVLSVIIKTGTHKLVIHSFTHRKKVLEQSFYNSIENNSVTSLTGRIIPFHKLR